MTTEVSIGKLGNPKIGLTKAAQRIMAAQKQPPGPTLFFGNLGFEVTENSIRQLLEAHRKNPVRTPVGDGGEENPGEHDDEPKGPKEEVKWIRKIRMGTFEDSGKCKGCVTLPPPTAPMILISVIQMMSGGHSLTSRQRGTPRPHSSTLETTL